jgi:hypothetical protein
MEWKIESTFSFFRDLKFRERMKNSSSDVYPGSARLLGLLPSPGPLNNMGKYVYHRSPDQVAALGAPHDNTCNPGR